MKKSILIILIIVLFILPTGTFAATSYDTYVWQKLVSTGVNTTAAAAQIQELNKEISAIVTRGSLAPLVMHYSDQPSEGYEIYQDRGRIIQTLAMAYPYVNSSIQSQIVSYVKNTLSSGDENFMTNKLKNAKQGVQRRLHGDSSADTIPNNTFDNIPSLHVIYGMWLYGDKTGDWTTVQSHWSQLKTFYNNNKNSNILYGSLNGYIAMARLAKQFNDQTTLSAVEADITSQFAQALNPTTIETRQKSTLYRFFYDPRKEEYFSGQPWMYLNTSPETLRYISDNSAIKSDYLNRLQTFERIYSPWWITQLPVFTRWTGDEGIGATPEMMNLFFNRERYVLKKPASTLSEYMRSIPLGIGDIFWIEALIGSIESNGQDCWENLNTSTTECNPNITGIPQPTVITKVGDANGDSKVNGQDYIYWLNNYGLTVSSGASKGDFNNDTKVSGLDYILWLNNYGS